MEIMCVFRISKIKNPNMIAAIVRSNLPDCLGFSANTRGSINSLLGEKD